MAEQQSTDPGVPLPDPDAVQQTFEKTLARVRARPNYYLGWGVLVMLAVLAVIFVTNLDRGGQKDAFGPLWRRCDNVRQKLRINMSAAAELVELEGKHVGFWLSTYGLDDARVERLQAALDERTELALG